MEIAVFELVNELKPDILLADQAGADGSPRETGSDGISTVIGIGDESLGLRALPSSSSPYAGFDGHGNIQREDAHFDVPR